MARFELTIMRHGEAEGPRFGQDIDRQLTPRGLADAGKAGIALSAQRQFAQVLVSAAKRTRQTWHEVQRTGRLELEATFAESLYFDNAAKIFNWLETIYRDQTLLIGHNPAVSQLIDHLTGEPGIGLSPADAYGLWVDADDAASAIQMTGCWQAEHIVIARNL